jgi:hypothetical protein
MKKMAFFGFLAASLFSLSAEAAVTVEYHNGDSQKHSFDAKCSGSSYKVEFSSSTTGATTIQGSAPCEVKHKGGTVTLKGGEKLEIKDGVIKVK